MQLQKRVQPTSFLWQRHVAIAHLQVTGRSMATSYLESCTLKLEQGSHSLADAQNVMDL